jgi:hypothetical protein
MAIIRRTTVFARGFAFLGQRVTSAVMNVI